jgi:hypothetical protein
VYPEKDKRETEKRWVIPTLFTKFKLDKCLFVVSLNTPRPEVSKESTRSASVEIQHFEKEKQNEICSSEREIKTDSVPK